MDNLYRAFNVCELIRFIQISKPYGVKLPIFVGKLFVLEVSKFFSIGVEEEAHGLCNLRKIDL